MYICTADDCSLMLSSPLCSQSQYIFLYETIMEGITHDYDEFPVTSLKQRLAQLEDVDQEGLSGAEKEFRVSCQWHSCSSLCVAKDSWRRC